MRTLTQWSVKLTIKNYHIWAYIIQRAKFCQILSKILPSLPLRGRLRIYLEELINFDNLLYWHGSYGFVDIGFAELNVCRASVPLSVLNFLLLRFKINYSGPKKCLIFKKITGEFWLGKTKWNPQLKCKIPLKKSAPLSGETIHFKVVRWKLSPPLKWKSLPIWLKN